jgi:hypothetical protein
MTGVSVKFGDLIRQFEGSGDFSVWLQKLELVAQLQEVKNLQSFLPLFLSEGAFAVYQGLSDDDKKDYDKVKRALRLAFTAGPFKANEEFTARRLATGEQVDVYLADLKRLAGLVDAEVSIEGIKCAFVAGLPDDVKAQLQAACSLAGMELGEVAEKARSLLTVKEACFASIHRSGPGERREGAVGRRDVRGREAQITCYACGESGHMSRECPDRRSRFGGGRAVARFCYACGEEGHMAAFCSQKKTEPTKNEKGRPPSAAPAASQ